MCKVIGEARLKATNELIARYIRPQSSVIEIGSNDASYRDFHSSRSWTTVDKYGSPDIKADLDHSGAHLPFESDSADIVICTEVLEHLRMGSPLVVEMSRVLKSTGVAVISVPNICSLKSRFKMIFGRLPNLAASGDCGNQLGGSGVLLDGIWVGGHVVDFNYARLRGYLKRGGLEISDVQKVAIEIPSRIVGRSIRIPRWLLSVSLGDFILVAAIPVRK